MRYETLAKVLLVVCGLLLGSTLGLTYAFLKDERMISQVTKNCNYLGVPPELMLTTDAETLITRANAVEPPVRPHQRTVPSSPPNTGSDL